MAKTIQERLLDLAQRLPVTDRDLIVEGVQVIDQFILETKVIELNLDTDMEFTEEESEAIRKNMLLVIGTHPEHPDRFELSSFDGDGGSIVILRSKLEYFIEALESQRPKPMKLPEIYYTNDYPREGCKIEIEIPKAIAPRNRGWGVTVFAPDNYRTDDGRRVPLAQYAAASLAGALIVAECEGSSSPVPADYYRI